MALFDESENAAIAAHAPLAVRKKSRPATRTGPQRSEEPFLSLFFNLRYYLFAFATDQHSQAAHAQKAHGCRLGNRVVDRQNRLFTTMLL